MCDLLLSCMGSILFINSKPHGQSCYLKPGVLEVRERAFTGSSSKISRQEHSTGN